MKQFTIYGNPVEHSKSPQMHNKGFENINFNAIYTKTLLEDGKQLKEHFLYNNISGANITVPHKEIAFNLADEVIGVGKEIKAVNTYINKDNKVIAYNTDGDGFMMAIEEFKGIKKALVLGAGGTSRALCVILKKNDIDITVVNRSEKKLKFFKDLGCKTYSWKDFVCSDYNIIINSTSAGLKDDTYPIEKTILEKIFKNTNYAIDCIYGKMTPFLTLAKDMDIAYKDGEDMLLFQGVIAFELFTNTKANKRLIKAMRQGLRSDYKKNSLFSCDKSEANIYQEEHL
jgi:shikimate dehydrogenase